MSQPPISETLQQAIAEVVDEHVEQIRRQARIDAAAELERAGHPAAARYLRTR